jgi:hypothetical protein
MAAIWHADPAQRARLAQLPGAMASAEARARRGGSSNTEGMITYEDGERKVELLTE